VREEAGIAEPAGAPDPGRREPLEGGELAGAVARERGEQVERGAGRLRELAQQQTRRAPEAVTVGLEGAVRHAATSRVSPAHHDSQRCRSASNAPSSRP
jgi:hypothetical protein